MAAMGAVAAARAPAFAQSSGRPNILFLISDDHSAPDLGCYGNRAIHTPHLDRLAGQGMRFDNGFVSSPQCSPNRSSIFSGCTPHTTATSRLHTPYPEWEPSFVEMLKEQGYFTGASRKVHQGEAFNRRFNYYQPQQKPFEKFFETRPESQPFFLHVGFSDPHRPYRKGALTPPHDPAKVEMPDFLPDTPAVRADVALYYDEIARMDSECGEILDILDRRGLTENTLVVFMGDNGMPFPRAKGSLYDAGIKVPTLARWPGKIKPGTVTDQLMSSIDLPVTWLAMAGVSKPDKMQGRSLLPLFAGDPAPLREAVFSERNWHNTFDPMRCVRTERYKLIFNTQPRFPYRPAYDLERSATWQSYLAESRKGEGSRLEARHWQLLEPSRPLFELYDLETDPGEFNNRATDPALADVRRDLEYKLSDWMHETSDFLPPLWKSYPAQSRSGLGRARPARPPLNRGPGRYRLHSDGPELASRSC